MPRLTDVFASILSDLAAARKMADEQTVRMAEEYHRDPLLGALTVPRIRIADVTVELPLLVESCEPGLPPATEDGAAGDRSISSGSPEKASPDSFARIASAALAQAAAESSRAQQSGGVSTLEVTVSADDIKHRGEGVPITRLRITLREEGMELVAAGDATAGEGGRDLDGKGSFRLIPE